MPSMMVALGALLVLNTIIGSISMTSQAVDLTLASQRVQEVAAALNTAADGLESQAAGLDGSNDPVGAALLRQQEAAARKKASDLITVTLPKIDEAAAAFKNGAKKQVILGIIGLLLPTNPTGLISSAAVADVGSYLGLPPGPDQTPAQAADRFLQGLGLPRDALSNDVKKSLAMDLFRRRVQATCITNGQVDYVCLNLVLQQFTKLRDQDGISRTTADVIDKLLAQIKDLQSGCSQWDITGTWQASQGAYGLTIVFAQTGTTLAGTASLSQADADTAGYSGTTAKLVGSLKGSTLVFVATWPPKKTSGYVAKGEYDGTVVAGASTGTAKIANGLGHDQSLGPNAPTAAWNGDGPGTCVAP